VDLKTDPSSFFAASNMSFWNSKMIARFVKRLVVSIAGMTVLLIGIVMIITPGPATLVILAGLAILAAEYAWAYRSLQALSRRLETMADKLNLRPLFLKFQAILLCKTDRSGSQSA
jgi:uncharacterized protein (TIGR02611 family)